MHAIQVLREDHARIAALFKQLTGTDAQNVQDETRLFERLENELTVHILAEDKVFLPHVEEAIEDSKRATDTFFEQSADVLEEASGLIQASYENHRKILALLEESKRLGEQRGEKLAVLKRTVAFQADEENKLFPKAELVLEEEDFERIGDLLEHCKGQVRGLDQAKLASSSAQPSNQP